MADNRQANAALPPLLNNPPPQAPPAGRGRGRRDRRRPQVGAAPGVGAPLPQRAPRQAEVRGPPPPWTGPPAPRNLATTNTPERNDPLWSTGHGGAELTPQPSLPLIFSGCEALPSVISVIYASYVSSSNGFARRVTESAFAYYCAVATYHRLLFLHMHNGFGMTSDEERFVDQVSSLNLEVPKLLAHYLSGFGNTRLPAGRDLKFQLRDRSYAVGEGVRGYFGQVNALNAPLYQNYPCLAVFAERMRRDVSEDEYSRHWTLPARFRPALQGGVRPSPALLGYAHRARITQAQKAFIEGAGVYGDTPFPSVNVSLPLCLQLMSTIQVELQAVSTRKLSPLPTSIAGSQAQLTITSYEDELDGLVPPIAKCESPCQLPPEITFPASAYLYRVWHDVGSLTEERVAPWVPWEYAPSPQWNRVALAGNDLRSSEPEVLGLREYRTTPYLVRARLEDLDAALNRH